MSMKEICRTTVGRKAPKPNFVYPIVRLPSNYEGLIGKHVTLYETSCDGTRAVIMVFNDGVVPPVVQPVVQPCENSQSAVVQTRLSELEKRMGELEGRCTDFPHAPSTTGEGAYPDGPGRIRTGDLRRVRATSYR